MFGVVLLATSGALAAPLGFPTSWSIPFGVAMIGGGACVLLTAGYPVITRRAAAVIATVNGLSAIGLALLTVSGWIPLTAAGVGFLLFGAALVAVFATVELVGLRRIAPEAPLVAPAGGTR
ncbi:hypothetical protein [Agrococcus sp. ARC_14]|uniref:hypothetical protein n=1 Tax=Agrococcus sp. ARC_14 TaxID=2919927 RepID=UPI001F067BA6|nr:hypothetical protein [Agrococcus sp. ARC_14]